MYLLFLVIYDLAVLLSPFLEWIGGAGMMAQQLRMIPALAEDLGLFHITHGAAHGHL